MRYMGRFSFNDLNDVTSTGFWQLYMVKDIVNIPTTSLWYGVLVCFNAGNFIIQECYKYDEPIMWRRVRSDIGEWSDWKEFK